MPSVPRVLAYRGQREKQERDTATKGLQVDIPCPNLVKTERCPHPTIRNMRKEMRRITGGEEKRITLAPL